MALRRVSLALFATSILGALLLASSAAFADGSAPSTGDVIEEVRTQVLDNGLVVEHHVLIDRTLTDNPAAVADELTGIPKDTEPSFSAQYKLNTWKWSPDQIPVPVSYNPSNETGSLPAALPWIQSAISQWSGVTSLFSFTYAGSTSAGLGACSTNGDTDGINTISFTSGMSKPVLGQTCTLSTRGGRIVEFDMQLNNTTNWGAGNPTTKPQYDLPSTILHEMGHAAGLGHSSDAGSIMYASLAQGVMKRTLTQDDIDGLNAQYPGGTQPPTPTPTPTPLVIPPYDRNFERIVVAVSRD